MNQKERFDVIIVGAGASGLACVVGIIMKCLKNNQKLPQILIIEKNQKPGKKLLMTGNGRCNVTHKPITIDAYHGEDISFAQYALDKYNWNNIVDFFSELGMDIAFDQKGRGYPFTLHSGTVLDCLRFAIEDQNIRFVTSTEVSRLTTKNDRYLLETNSKDQYVSDLVVLAVGGACAPQTGSDGRSYALAESLGHKITAIRPGLVQIKTDNSFVKKLAGLRFDAKVCLYVNQKRIRSEWGEVLFTDYGISGPVALQLSSEASRILQNVNSDSHILIKIDFLPHLNRDDVFDLLHNRADRFKSRSIDRLLAGLFVNRLATALIRYADNIPMSENIGQLNEAVLNKLTDAIKGIEIPVLGVRGLNDAQVTIGGLDTRDFSPQTMESKCAAGMYAIGEVLDIDGDCGGYNLHWAWASALVAADSIVHSLEQLNG